MKEVKIENTKNEKQLQFMRNSCEITAKVLNSLKEMIRPGLNTKDLDTEARKLTKKMGATPAFLGYMGYPSAVCVSVNEQVVHGIPDGSRVLKEGDIVSVDFGVKYNGFYGDSAFTAGVGAVNDTAVKLMKVTEEALFKGIEKAVAGAHLYDISAAIQQHSEKNGFSVVRKYTGHGIGEKLHEFPQIPNFGKPGNGPVLTPGTVLAIEPMLNEKGFDVYELDDDWTVVTKDGGLSAHFEHTIAVTENGPEILTKLQEQ